MTALAAELAVGMSAGVGAGALSMLLLRRQVGRLAAGRGGPASALAGMTVRLVLVGAGLAAALAWSLYCGLAFAGALVLTRLILVNKVRSSG